MHRSKPDQAFDALRGIDPGPGGEEVSLDAVRARVAEESRVGVVPAARRFRPRLRLGLGVTACAVVAISAAVFFGGTPVSPETRPAFAAEAIEAAQASPRLLVGEEGWRTEYVSELEPGQGSISYLRGSGDPLTPGTETLDIDWGPTYVTAPAPGGDVGQWFLDRSVGCARAIPEGADSVSVREATQDCKVYFRTTEATALGETVRVEETRHVQPGEPSGRSFSTLLPLADGAVAIYGRAPSLERFEQTLASLSATDVDTWLSSLPPRFVLPPERPEVVDEMIAGLPLPGGLDAESLRSEFAAQGRYGVGAAVTGAIACGWLDRWAAALDSGDQAAAREAVEAMATSRRWPILREMANEGGWSQTVWEYADEMAADDRKALLGSSGTESTAEGVFELRPAYASGLGCESERRRKIADEPKTIEPPPGKQPLPVSAPPG